MYLRAAATILFGACLFGCAPNSEEIAARNTTSNVTGLLQYREQALFQHWAPDVPDDRIVAAEDTVNRLIDEVVALGPNPQETDVRNAVGECVRRFNELDKLDANGWIFTIEREDISEAIWRVVELAGFALDDGPDDSWTKGREW